MNILARSIVADEFHEAFDVWIFDVLLEQLRVVVQDCSHRVFGKQIETDLLLDLTEFFRQVLLVFPISGLRIPTVNCNCAKLLYFPNVELEAIRAWFPNISH